jgi:hypothetical protein
MTAAGILVVLALLASSAAIGGAAGGQRLPAVQQGVLDRQPAAAQQGQQPGMGSVEGQPPCCDSSSSWVALHLEAARLVAYPE